MIKYLEWNSHFSSEVTHIYPEWFPTQDVSESDNLMYVAIQEK